MPWIHDGSDFLNLHISFPFVKKKQKTEGWATTCWRPKLRFVGARPDVRCPKSTCQMTDVRSVPSIFGLCAWLDSVYFHLHFEAKKLASVRMLTSFHFFHVSRFVPARKCPRRHAPPHRISFRKAPTRRNTVCKLPVQLTELPSHTGGPYIGERGEGRRAGRN